MSYLTVNKIRNRCWTAISPYTAAMAGDGMTVENIKQFIAGAFTPSDAQLRALANYFEIKV